MPSHNSKDYKLFLKNYFEIYGLKNLFKIINDYMMMWFSQKTNIHVQLKSFQGWKNVENITWYVLSIIQIVFFL